MKKVIVIIVVFVMGFVRKDSAFLLLLCLASVGKRRPLTLF